jgi:hypothetical protein
VPESSLMKVFRGRAGLLMVLVGAVLSGCGEQSLPDPHIIATAGIHDCDGRAVAIASDNQSIQLQGQCAVVTMRGTGNAISIAAANRILVDGPGNVLSVAAADQITVRSAGNSVAYARGVNSARPVVVATGDNNSLVQLR